MSAQSPSHDSRKIMAITPQSSSAAVTGLGFLVRGWRWCELSLMLGAMTATGTSDVIVEESDSLGSGYVAVAGAVFPQKVAATHANKIYTMQIDCSKRKKYLRVVATQATAASLVAVEAVLSLPDTTERAFVAQEASAAPASPLTETDFISV